MHVQPRASKTGLAGLHGDAIKLRIAAPPVDGAANEAVVRFLAHCLGISRGRVSIVAGQTGRRKTVTVLGITPERAREVLASGPEDGRRR